jgi:hypothetical protein
MEDSVFCVRFFKDLQDSSGHTHKCIQGVVKAAAPDKLSAVVMACSRFAKQAGVPDWSLRADYETVECLSGDSGAP